MADQGAGPYTRDELIAICERAIVPESKWLDRDSASAQRGVGLAWAWLRAGCPFVFGDGYTTTNETTIWIKITARGFMAFEMGDEDEYRDRELIYLPTPARLDAVDGKDWY